MRGISIIFKNNFVLFKKITIFALELESKLKEHRKTEKLGWEFAGLRSDIVLFNNITEKEWANISSHFVMTTRAKRPKSALPMAFF